MEFFITNEPHPSHTDEAITLLTGPRLWIPRTDYPDFDKWAHRAQKQINTGEKRLVVAYRDRRIAGVIIYQRHKEDPETLEIKNITLPPDQWGRHLGSFLLRNVEFVGQEDFPGVTDVVVDAKANNMAIQFFLKANRYREYERRDLYNLGAGEDIVYRKPLGLRRVDEQ